MTNNDDPMSPQNEACQAASLLEHEIFTTWVGCFHVVACLAQALYRERGLFHFIPAGFQRAWRCCSATRSVTLRVRLTVKSCPVVDGAGDTHTAVCDTVMASTGLALSAIPEEKHSTGRMDPR